MNNPGTFDKVLLVEMRPGIDLSAENWQPGDWDGADSYRALGAWDPLDGELVGIEVDGVQLETAYSIPGADAQEGTFFYDRDTGAVVLHLAGDEDPTGHTVVGFFWLCLSNRQGVAFTPEGNYDPVDYKPYLGEESIPNLTQSVADYYTAAVQIQFGSISCTNDGWWYTVRTRYLWNNKEVYVRLGQAGDDYGDFMLVFPGRIRRPTFGDAAVEFEVKDMRVGTLGDIPTERFSAATYPNIEDGAVDKEIPVLFGEKTNITPTLIDSATNKYKISQTTWGGLTFPLEAVTAVYKAGALLTLTTDYTVDLTNGEITLAATAGDALVTVDAKGICCKFNLTDGAPTYEYAETAAHFLFFVLNVMNGIPVAFLNLQSFQELSVGRTQKLAWYLDACRPTTDFVRLLQQSAIFHLVPLLDGTFSAIYYRRAVPVDAPALDDLDFTSFKIWAEADNVYKSVAVKYAMDPSTQLWKVSTWTQDSAQWLHDEGRTLTVETALTATAEAEAIRDFYVQMVQAPADKVTAGVNLTALDFYPTEKVILSRQIEGSYQETPIEILNAAVYRILSLNKNLATGAVDFVAQIDSQASAYAIHADISHVDQHGDHTDSDPHVDSNHTDDYTDHSDTVHEDAEHQDNYSDHSDNAGHLDTSHADVAHVDSHTDTHADVAHSDVAHSDTHGDVAHADISHLDSYTDTHADVAHADVAHSDVAHADVAHQDVAHTDTHGDVHSDRDLEPHWDSYYDVHSDVAHADTHTDVAHSDVAHTDTHTDTHSDKHTDRAHTDTHTDTHSDVAHTDTHTDSYTDTHADSHTDAEHQDHTDATHDDSHTDQAEEDHTDAQHDDSYSDLPHQDHTDSVPHADTAHADSHTDSHSDRAHSDSAHSDVAHADTPYSDVAHGDEEHQDGDHFDHDDGIVYDDSHSDYPHVDVAHQDSHSDTAHADSAHSDTAHADSHSDVAHQDTTHLDHTDEPHLDYHGDVTHDDSSV